MVVVAVVLFAVSSACSAVLARSVNRAYPDTVIPYRGRGQSWPPRWVLLFCLALGCGLGGALVAAPETGLAGGYVAALVCTVTPLAVIQGAHNRRVRRDRGA